MHYLRPWARFAYLAIRKCADYHQRMTHLDLLMFLQFVGIAAFAVSGALVAGERQMDWFGVMTLGIIVAVGGGTLRDIMLDMPVFWISEPWYVALAAAVALATIPLARWSQRVRRPISIADAVGLSVFVILGTRKALDAGTPGIVAIIMGVVTGIFGGIIRDVLANRTPIILRREIYALAALTGAAFYVAGRQFDMPIGLNLWCSMAIILIVRLLAIARNWSVPTFRIDPTEPR